MTVENDPAALAIDVHDVNTHLHGGRFAPRPANPAPVRPRHCRLSIRPALSIVRGVPRAARTRDVIAHGQPIGAKGCFAVGATRSGGAGAGLRSGSWERHRPTYRILGPPWSRSRAGDGSASGRGTPPSGGSEGRVADPGRTLRRRPHQKDPKGDSPPWHEKAGTTMNAAISISTPNAMVICGATSATNTIEDGHNRHRATHERRSTIAAP